MRKPQEKDEDLKQSLSMSENNGQLFRESGRDFPEEAFDLDTFSMHRSSAKIVQVSDGPER